MLEDEEAIRSQIAVLEARRFLRTLAIVQDLADALLTLPDLGGKPPAVVTSLMVKTLTTRPLGQLNPELTPNTLSYPDP